MNHPAQAESGPGSATQPSRPVPAAPPEAPPAAEDAGGRDEVGDDGDCEMPDEDYARYEPL
jgi:hypothetical protein